MSARAVQQVSPITRAVTRLRASTASAMARAAFVFNSPALARTALVVSGRVHAARRARLFAGAKMDRLTADFFSGTTSGAQDTRMDLRILRARSRTLVRDTPQAKRACDLFVENVVGAHGILLKPAALRPDGNADTALNDAVLYAWEDWGTPEHCSVDGQYGWPELEQQLMKLLPMDGEVLVRMLRGREFGKYGFQVQLIDADQLDLTYNVEPYGDGRWVRQGVELNRWGRPIAYWIWQGHPNDTRRGERLRIPAEDIIHWHLPWRVGATRGVPWFHAVVSAINMSGGYFEAALVAARIAASAMGAIKTNSDPDPLQEQDPDADAVPVDFDPGKLFRLAAGEEVQKLDWNHPNTSFADFDRAVDRKIATGIGVAYTSLSGDLTAVNFSSIRAGLLSERDFYRLLQQRMIRYVHARVHREWLRMAQLTGALPISALDLSRAARVRWQPRGFPWVDPRADIEALEAEIALGINSRTAAAAERGRDFEKVLEQLDAEKRLADTYGVDVDGLKLPRPTEQPTDDEDKTGTTTTSPAPARGLRSSNG